MIGLCGAASLDPNDHGRVAADRMSQVFTESGGHALRSVRWNLPDLSCCLFYRESERLPCPDARLESVADSQPVTAFVFGNVCLPHRYDCTSKDPLLRAGTYIETSYSQGGVESLAGINGNWVAAIRDNASESFVLSRDPVGIQVLYYTLYGQLLCFATHLSAFLELGSATQVDRTGVAQFLHFLYVPSPRTTFEGVSCVPVGKAVVMNREGISFRPLHSRGRARYWKEKRGERAEIGAGEALNTLDGMLTSAVLELTAPSGRTDFPERREGLRQSMHRSVED